MAPADYVFVRRCRPVTNDGLPHSDTPGSKPYGGSPRLVAALCVLLRLLMPRHPSCARIRLARNLLEPLDLDISLKVSFAPLKYLFAFSYRLLITNIFQRFNWNIFSFILGKFYTRTDVGNYTKSAEWFNMGGEVVNGMVNAVAQPALAKVVNDSELQLHVFRKMLRFTAFVAFPLMFGLSLVSKEIIIVVITDKWIESAEMLQLLAIWGAFMPIQSMFTNLLVSCGRSRTFMWCTIVQGVLMLAILLAVHSYGIKQMIVCYCIFNVVWLFVWLYFAKKEIAIRLTMFLRDVLPYMLLSAIVMSAAHFVTVAVDDMFLRLVLKIAVSALLYLTVAVMMRSNELKEITEFLSKRNKEVL